MQKDVIKNLDKNVKNNSYFNYEFYFSLLQSQTKNLKTSLFLETLKKLLLEVDLTKELDADYSKEIEKVLKDAGRLDKETLDTINKEINEIVKKTKANNQNLSRADLITEIAKIVNNKFDLVYKASRVKMIGRTVATFTSESSKSETAKKYKFKLQWISERDSRVRKSHRQADGQIQNEKGKFKIGQYETSHPCGSGLPAGEVVNCRCVTRGIRN